MRSEEAICASVVAVTVRPVNGSATGYSFYHVSPTFAVGRMFVDLAHEFWYLRPVAVQASSLEEAQVANCLLILGDLHSKLVAAFVAAYILRHTLMLKRAFSRSHCRKRFSLRWKTLNA